MSRGPASATHDRRARRGRWLAVRLLVSAGVLALLLAVLPWDQVSEAASRMSVPIYLGAIVGFLAAHSVGAAKWRLMLGASGSGNRLSVADTAGCYGAGLFSNLFLPTVVGGDVVRAGLAARALGRTEAVVLGSVADRLIDFVALGLLLAGGALLAGAELRGWTGPLVGLVVIVGVAGGLLALPFALRRPLARWPRPIRRRMGRGLVALRHLRRRPHAALVALVLALAMQATFILISAWLGATVGAHAPLWVWFMVWPLAKVAGMLPVTLGGLGVRDAALASLLVPFGVPAAFGLVASLAWNAVLIGGAVLGGALWWIIRPGAARRVSRRSEQGAGEPRTPTTSSADA